MVSPSKKKRLDKKGRENFGGTPQRVADISGAKKFNKSGRKPFLTKKFYLDVRNHTTLAKLEKQLKDLGASIELFLDHDVNYVITDRNGYVNGAHARLPSPANSLSLTPSPLPSPSPSPINSPSDVVGIKRTRSRAEAMLECVRVQPNRVLTVDPLDNARAWKIPIYPLQTFLRWLERVVSKLSSSSGTSGRPSGIKVLRGHFIKVEAAGRRPEFRELRSWPAIRYETRCPFDSPSKKRGAARGGGTTTTTTTTGKEAAGGNDANKSSRRDRMTRKQSVTTDDHHNGSGYCEMCCLDYSDLSLHLASAGHVKLATDPSQFAALDTLIKESCLDTFLHTNGDMCPTLAGATRRVLRSNKTPPALENNIGNGGPALVQTNHHHNSHNHYHTANHASMGNRNSGSAPDKDKDKERERDSKEKAPPSPNSVSTTCSSSVLTNGHVTRSTTASHRQLSHDVEPAPKKMPPQEVQLNGAAIHCHLTRLSVRTDISGSTVNSKDNSPAIGGGAGNGTCGEAPPKEAVAETGTGRKERSRTSSSSGSMTRGATGAEQLSPACDTDGSSHHLRSKKQLWLPTSLLGTTAEDEGNPIRAKNEAAAMTAPRLVSPKIKRRKLRRKRLSVEEKLIEDNKSYYKVEVLNSKLRSTGYYLSQRELELGRLKAGVGGETTATEENSTDQTSKLDDKEPVVVRFKKVRKSELSLLSDEAENFMFGEPSRNRDSSEETSDDDEEEEEEATSNENTSSSFGHGRKKDAAKKDDLDENSLASSNCSSSNLSLAKRKRRTHAEVFIHDNLDYYKFDLPGSRLRFQGAYFPPVDELKIEVGGDSNDATPDKKSATCKTAATETDDRKAGKVGLLSTIKEEIKQEAEEHNDTENDDDEDGDDGDEDYKEFTADELAFSFESIPSQEPWYQTYMRQDYGDEFYSPMYTTYPRIRLPYEYPNYQKIYLWSSKKMLFPFRKRKRRSRKKFDDKPRKSPRCHASTLAILSSLKFRRKRDSPLARLQAATAAASTAGAAATADASTPKPPVEPRTPVAEMSTLSLPDPKPETKRKPETNLNLISENIDALFYKFYNESVECDKYAKMLKLLGHGLELIKDDGAEPTTGAMHSPSTPTTTTPKSGKSTKSPKSSPKSEHSPTPSGATFDSSDVCLDVDPSILVEAEGITTTLVPGPECDISILLDGYKQCNSMERADYQHLHPRAIDALRLRAMAIDGSCNSSDCGNSSTCELLGFTEDGRMLSKRRKRKKRNLTGWPKDKPRKFLKQKEEAASRAGSSAKGGKFVTDDEEDDDEDDEDSSRVALAVRIAKREDEEKTQSAATTDTIATRGASEQSEVRVETSIPKIKVTRSLSRTGSLDSSTISSEYSTCVVPTDGRQLRGQPASSSAAATATSNLVKRRASSPEKRPARGRKKRNCVTRWSSHWTTRRGR